MSDAIVRELEEQRNFMAARAARFAGMYAEAQSERLKAEERVKELEAEKAAAAEAEAKKAE